MKLLLGSINQGVVFHLLLAYPQEARVTITDQNGELKKSRTHEKTSSLRSASVSVPVISDESMALL